ncbi:MAG: hypothetical protein AAF228_06485 [Pseudomonadota bacterium]
MRKYHLTWTEIVNISFIFVFSYISIILLHPTPLAHAKAKKNKSQKIIISRDISKLPANVQHMHARILQVAKSGKLKNMREVLESNEILPVVSFGGATDPLEYWTKISKDGRGYDILAVLVNILQMDFAILNQGTKEEKYVWPYLAEYPIKALNEPQRVDLYRLMPHQDIQVMKKSGDYLYYRLGIGNDGTWHFFVAGD